LLALLGDLGAAAGRFGFGLFLRRVALRLGLVLLGLALAHEVATACDGPDEFLCLAFGILDDALYRFGRSRVAVRHWILLVDVVVWATLDSVRPTPINKRSVG